VDLRVILPTGDEFAALRTLLESAGTEYREVPNWVEREEVGTITDDGASVALSARPALSHLPGAPAAVGSCTPVGGRGAAAARDAFALLWDALSPGDDSEEPEPLPTADLVPPDWAALLPHPTFNPAQQEAVPVLLKETGHVVVVAPTGAGKTPIGMVAALEAHSRGKKAAWLVPQRSLTDELDRDLARWRTGGLRVVRLSGESATDAELIRQADIWVATTEKFESLCRTASLRDALADVGCLVVDEIHLLGDPTRGPVLEAVLARVRESADQVRIVGLSATVANAETIATWLGARLVRTAWRPTRLLWQLPLLPMAQDRTAEESNRTRMAVDLTEEFTADGGSVLVFCGSKRNLRSTALAVAASRGAQVRGIDPDDTDRVHEVCARARVGLHYRDWPHKHEAEKAFRSKEFDVLVATSTVAAGVNLPARAVIVRDTRVGLDDIEVSMVQQMFGRAGRIGAGEREGWAFLLTDESEHALWQARLAAGYTVTSQIHTTLPDHVLAETVQQRVTTTAQARTWWSHTLAFHQGHHDLDPLHQAIDFLTDAGMLTRTERTADTEELAPTDLGRLTTRLMVSTAIADELRHAVNTSNVPTSPRQAEERLILLAAGVLPELEYTPPSSAVRSSVATILREGGHLADTAPNRAPQQAPAPGDFARAVLLALANTPRAFATSARFIAGIPVDSMRPVLTEAERYLHWLGAQGPLATVHPWAAIVAADLARRIRWRHLAPRRGSGRLLWILEAMATAPAAQRLVPKLWQAATARGITAPDWPAGTRPSLCELNDTQYTALLHERTTGADLRTSTTHADMTSPAAAVAVVWNAGTYRHHHLTDSTHDYRLPYPETPTTTNTPDETGSALFTRRGDGVATGWLEDYRAISSP
jgi:helicase